MQNLSLTGLAFLVFGFSLIFLAFSKVKMGWGTRIAVGLIGVALVPGAVSLTAAFLHPILFSPFFMVPVAICVGYYVWTQLRPKHY
jgi:hypothetical protein